MTADEQFFYDHAGWSYLPGAETPEEGRQRGARELVTAETEGRESGVSFDWSVDPDVDSSDWSDEKPAWQLWQCAAFDADGNVVASLHGVDFGRDGSPHGDPYRRVVEAELASESAKRASRASRV